LAPFPYVAVHVPLTGTPSLHHRNYQYLFAWPSEWILLPWSIFSRYCLFSCLFIYWGGGYCSKWRLLHQMMGMTPQLHQQGRKELATPWVQENSPCGNISTCWSIFGCFWNELIMVDHLAPFHFGFTSPNNTISLSLLLLEQGSVVLFYRPCEIISTSWSIFWCFWS
jgi:hypothetical protein